MNCSGGGQRLDGRYNRQPGYVPVRLGVYRSAPYCLVGRYLRARAAQFVGQQHGPVLGFAEL